MARAALAGASRPLTRRSKRLMGEWRLRGYPSFVRRKGILSKPSRNGLPARRLPTSRKSWEGGRWGSGGGGPFFRKVLPRPPSQRLLTDGEAARRLFRNAIAPNPPSSPQKKRARMRCASGLFSGFFPQSTCHSPSLLIQHRSRRFRLAGRGGGYAQRWHQEIRGIGKKGGHRKQR